MTAEIAVMNRNGVALAADSAVTVEQASGQKIYNTVNKLFMLSKYAPVGVMVYGNAQITGVPWETIVKEFRRELGEDRFSALEQYAAAFLDFLGTRVTLFPFEQEAEEMATHALGYFHHVLEAITRELHHLFAEHGSVRDGQVRHLVTQNIRDELDFIDAQPDLPGYPANYCSRLEKQFGAQLDAVIDVVFEKLPIGAVGRRRLKQLVCRFMTKDVFPSISSGVVVAGFGEDEHFPVLHAYDTQSVLMGKVKQRLRNSQAIAGQNGAAIIPFAQREMVDLFMTGVAPAYRETVQVAVEGFLDGLPTTLVENLPIRAPQRRALERRMKAAGREILTRFREHLDEQSQRAHIDPVVNAVAVLPKETLAEMAESLVDLTSFKHRVTMEPETVGGPIDVAVISKGDGFIWIKRKHYFTPELNQHFFANYFE